MNPELSSMTKSSVPVVSVGIGDPLIDPTREEKRFDAMSISPEQGKYWLKSFNQHNRHITIQHQSVIDYGRLMKDGMFPYNHSPLVFDWNKQLMDGQNRLLAGVRVDMPFIADVVFGLDPALRPTYDAKSRSVVDMLVMGGHPPAHPSQCAAVAKMLETVRRDGFRGLWDPKLYAGKQAVNAAIAQGRFSLLDRAAHVASRTRKIQHGCPPRVPGFCWYKFAEQDKETADRFIELFLTGLQLSEESPVYCLRNRLILSKCSIQKQIALFIKAWILFRNDQPCKRLDWRTDASNPEAFPEIA